MVISSNLGFPRMGSQRQLKRIVEQFWQGAVDKETLLTGAQVRAFLPRISKSSTDFLAKELRKAHWLLQQELGIEHVPSNDFSFYDQVLDHVQLFGAIPEKYQCLSDDALKQYFAMARGLQRPEEGIDVPAMEMKKWFDTNYHFIVPEFYPDQKFTLDSTPKPIAEFQEAINLGIRTRPVLLGPVSFLMLGKVADHRQDTCCVSANMSTSFDPLIHLDALLPLYEQLCGDLAELGASWLQLDEPILSLDLDVAKLKPLFIKVYTRLAQVIHERGSKLLLANYFGRLGDNIDIVVALTGLDAFHQDFVRAPGDLPILLTRLPQSVALSMGVINGRNIWKADFSRCLEQVRLAVEQLGTNRILIAPSCSLLHSPFSLDAEKKMSPEIRDWLSFAVEKLTEIQILTRAFNEGPNVVAEQLEANRASMERHRFSPLIHNQEVQAELRAVNPAMLRRLSPFSDRVKKQSALLKLPMFPTTTIGSFPQTKEVRVGRQKFKKGEWTQEQYDLFIRDQIRQCVHLQEEIGLDVLVHGEPERNDMVEFFGENMRGYVFSENGWVQSYGSRCVKPPIIFGDVSRPNPMTVDTAVLAQSFTTRPMKGMLTGPVTMLQWSFVRDDQPRSVTTQQLALAIRKEVQDLERAAIKVIQIDEPAIREGLPLRKSDWDAYLQWAVDAFLLASTGVNDETQIHSHFCYSDFNDIFPSIQRLDADVITIENARSDLKLLEAFRKHSYQNHIGPGIYDIHSPRVPSTKEMLERLDLLVKFVPAERLWINPDCGLKTRRDPEVKAALINMVQVARSLRTAVEE